MPAKRELSMRQLRHLLRLHHDGVNTREIGRRLGGGAKHDPGQSETGGGGGRAQMAAGGRRHRGGSGTPALRRQAIGVGALG